MNRHRKSKQTVIWEEWSLTTKLLTIMMTLMLLVLTGTSAWVLENLRASLIERTDERLISASDALAIQAAEQVFLPAPLQGGDQVQSNPQEESLRNLLPGSYYVQFYSNDGNTAFEPVAPDPTNVPYLPDINQSLVSERAGHPFTVEGTSSHWRALALQVEGTPWLVAVAVPFDKDVDGISERARNTMVGIGLLALALVAGVGYFAITNTFRPLKNIEETASRIAAGDLSQRVSKYPRNTELGRLSAALNTMLGRIEDSFDGQTRSEKRIRQFVSDASHELRTPLVTIRGYAELYRQGALKDPEHIGQAMDRIEAEAKRMGVLVEDLVVLARLDERREAELGPVNICAIVRDAAADAAAQDPDRDISFIGLDGGDADENIPVIYGSEAKLRQVIVNLAGNAVRHTPPQTAIEFAVGVVGVPAEPPAPEAVDPKPKAPGFVTGPVRIFKRDKTDRTDPKTRPATGSAAASETGTAASGTAQTIVPDVSAAGGVSVSEKLAGFPAGRVRFEVRDHGDGIDAEDVPRIFERFYRLDASRNRDTGGSGLGLSIVKAIVESHQGRITVHPTPGGGATFRVDLPIPLDTPAASEAQGKDTDEPHA
ncbi:sensor histidine kinase [Brevibacterium sp. UBA7493]|uniref:sensor histidine kinase n=1 Tax=Brevibacterium sp. UBA7493 TaxID=1946121 RepID=UPI0039C873C0